MDYFFTPFSSWLLGLRRNWFDWLPVAAIAGLLGHAWLGRTVDGWQWSLGLATAFALLGWYCNLRQQQAVQNTPLSRVGSTSQGYARLRGQARPLDGEPLVSPFGTRCVWYHCVEAEVDRSPQGSRTRVLLDVVSEHSFLLDDGSGACLIDPTDAAMRVGEPSVTWYQDLRRTEWWIFPGQEVEALGEFATLRADRSAPMQRARVSDKLATWKQDRATLLRQFDRDGNGEIDPEEWEQARAAAEREVLRDTIATANRDSADVLRKPRQRRPYLISTEDLDDYARRRRWYARGYLLAVLLLLHAMWWIDRRPALVTDHLEPPVLLQHTDDLQQADD
ncbi:hypothetical protein GCM10007860_08660 [Chitiniphilus shinanonensis]|uniref:EF-hand domain-containing protein n=1 Tax=Chitiniphilus shinanonensis TaxID=553088 RepID=A0ABQ6BQX1_9NEIS|nr:EF-hand domain-containing protein [Chitiniphilus shinanonensis]GLS03721.1 hypothetical protein GCM10007860_08660 [Chitiniphilus shinanonensis]